MFLFDLPVVEGYVVSIANRDIGRYLKTLNIFAWNRGGKSCLPRPFLCCDSKTVLQINTTTFLKGMENYEFVDFYVSTWISFVKMNNRVFPFRV